MPAPRLLAILQPRADESTIVGDLRLLRRRVGALSDNLARDCGPLVCVIVRRPAADADGLMRLLRCCQRSLSGSGIAVGLNPGGVARAALDRRALNWRELAWLQVPERADLSDWSALHGPSTAGGPIVGASVHDGAVIADTIARGAHFVLLSPVFATASKPHSAPLGLARLRAACASHPGKIYALGGVTAGNYAALIAAGARGVAAITAAWNPTDDALIAAAVAG